MTSTTIRRTGKVAVVASAVCMTLGLFTGSAFADSDEPALEASLSEPDAVAPGGNGDVTLVVKNVSDEATEGVLLNVMLPPHVIMNYDGHCNQTGLTSEGGMMISCQYNDDLGQLDPGESREAVTPFTIEPLAPASTELGEMSALVVPLEDGEATEDWRDLDGPNTATTPITTADGGWWQSITDFFS